MNFKDKELIIFDLDGTLINSIPDLAIAINKMLKHYDLSTINIETLTPFIGNGAKPLVQRSLSHAMGDKEISDELLEEAFAIYFDAYKNNICQETYLYEGVKETLNYLNDKAYKMVICTNKPFGFIEPILEALEIKEFFKAWIGEDSLPLKKPSAAPLLHLVERMDVTVDKSIMIGDSRNDILAARNASMQSIGVSYGYNYNESIADYNPTFVVENFSDLKVVF